jgi:transcriptional regulator GlxA family with amidase domain
MNKPPFFLGMVALLLGFFQGGTAIQAAEDAPKESVPRIGVVIFDGFLSSEVVAPVEVFGKPATEGMLGFEVVLVGEKMGPVKSHEGLVLHADYTFATTPALDVLVVPSSYNAAASEENKQVVRFVREQAGKVRYIASHCAGAFILGHAGVLDGRRVTTYVGGGALLQEKFPGAKVLDDMQNPLVVDGNLITSNGGLVSYEASIKLLEMMSSKKQADGVAAELFLSQMGKSSR